MEEKEIVNAKLTAIAERASTDLTAFIEEGEVKIQEAWDSIVEEAQANETKPVLALAFSVKLHLDEDKMETALRFGVKHKLSRDGSIPDPNQPDLLDDGMVELRSEGKTERLPLKEAVTKVVEGARKALREGRA